MAIFRDERVLRTGDDLPSGIRAGLEASDFLIYIASKEAAESDWVKQELRIWCDELKRSNQLLPVHISDRIKVDLETSRLDWQNTDAIPSGISNLQVLPVWADMTWASKEEQLDLSNVRYKAEINAIVAKLNGVLPGTMNDNEVITHRRNILARNIGIGLVIVSATVAVWFGIQALHQADIAKDERDTAVASMLIAQSNELTLTDPGKVIDATAMLLRSAASKPSPEAGFALRERLGQLARPVFQNGAGSSDVVFPLFSDGVASWRGAHPDGNSAQLEYFPWGDGQSLGRPDEPIQLPRARINARARWNDSYRVVVATAGTATWESDDGSITKASIPTKDYRAFDVAFPSSGPPRLAGSRNGKTIEVVDFGNPEFKLSIPYEQPIDLLAYSADAKWVAAARFKLDTIGNGPASEVTIFDAETGKEWTRLHPKWTMSDFVFSPVGDQAAALVGGSIVVMWDIVKRSPPQELNGGRVSPIDLQIGGDRVVFSPNGSSIGVSGDSRLRIWDNANGNLQTLRPGGVVRWLKFNDRGDLVAVTVPSGDIQVWDIARERMISFVPATPGRMLFPVRFGHMDQMLQVTDETGSVRLWQIDNQQETWRWPHLPLSWLPDSRRFLVSDKNEVYLWDADRGSGSVSHSMPTSVSRLAVRTDGKMAAATDVEGSLQIFTLPGLLPVKSVKIGRFPRIFQWAPDGTGLVVVAGRQVSFFNAPDLREQNCEAAAYDPDKLVFSPDGHYFTVGYEPRDYGAPGAVQPLQLWDSRTGKVIQQVAHGKVPEYVAFSSHSPYLISSTRGLIRIWQYPELRELAKWQASQGSHSIALSPDGSTVAAVVDDRIGLWKVPSGKSLGTITPSGRTASVAFTPDSRAIVAVSDTAKGTALMQAWSWPELRLITRFPVGSGLAPAMSFSPDGAYLVLHQIDHLERYLWRTEDLIPQGCRTLIEIAAVDIPIWCVAHSQQPSKGADATRSEPVDSARSRSAR